MLGKPDFFRCNDDDDDDEMLTAMMIMMTTMTIIKVTIFNNYSPKPEANNCFSIITQVIIEISIKQRNVKFYHNLPLLIRVHTRLLVSTCHAMHSYRVKTNQKVIYRGLYSYPQWLSFITLFQNNAFLLLRHVERVCKSF